MVRRSPPPPPSRIYLDLTLACSLRCRHCCASAGTAAADELTRAELEGLVDQVAGMGVRNLVLSGGDPMMRDGFFDIVEHAHRLRLAVTVLTNGTCIGEDEARAFARLGTRVKLSLDGVTAETHDRLRGPGNFERTVRALECLARGGVEDRTVHFTVHRENLGELEDLPGFLPTIDVRNVVVGIIKPAGRAWQHPELLIAPVMYPYVKQKIRFIEQFEGITVQSLKDKGWEGFGCPATCNKFGITATGRATTCVFFGDEGLGGSVRECSLQDLWHDYRTRDDVFTANPECSACPALPVSCGGCRARALYYHGDINAKDPYCCAMFEKKRFVDAHRAFLEAAVRASEPAF